MRAVIMCGGEGTRLRPITENAAKPMAKLVNKTAAEHIICLLKKHGITDIAVTLMYLPETVKSVLGNGEKYGVKLNYFTEETPLSTAGSVHNAAMQWGALNEPLLVISGDALCDGDLTSFMTFHQEKNADVSLLLCTKSDPREYGIAVTDDDGRILSFAEKPGWSTAISDTVNTGIYILSPQAMSMIPPKTKFDFSKELFPLMMKNGMRLYGMTADFYWQDIGEISSYLRGNYDVLDGKVKLEWEKSGGEDVIMPSYVSPMATVEKGARVGPYAVINDGCTVKKGAEIRASVLYEGCTVEENARVTGSVMCKNAVAEAESVMEGESVLGENARLAKGTRINGVTVKGGCLCEGESDKSEAWFDGAFCSDAKAERGFQAGVALANMCKKQQGYGRIGVMWDTKAESDCIAHALISGIIQGGGEALILGEGFLSMASFACREYELYSAVYVETHSRAEGKCSKMTLLDGNGVCVSRDMERKFNSAIRENTSYSMLSPRNAYDLRSKYQQMLAMSSGRLDGCQVQVYSKNEVLLSVLRGALGQQFCRNDGFIYKIAENGTSAVVHIGEKLYMWEKILTLLTAFSVRGNRESITLPSFVPDAAVRIAEGAGVTVKRTPMENAPLWCRDACFALFYLLKNLKENGISAEQAFAEVPQFSVHSRESECSCHERSEAIRKLVSAGGVKMMESGLEYVSERGRVHIEMVGSKGVKISAECDTTDEAKRLCREIEAKIMGRDMI
ncbi:MAG: hypothetical protein E7491_08115 [Ruminococcaceae bacterium]|nr:hypothetical protein [Oscillospiraceae bacterium]